MRDALVKFSPEITPKSTWLARNGFFKCNSCAACTFATNATEYVTAFGDKKIPIKDHLTCRTEFTIYKLRCTYGLDYIGSTKLPIHKRILQHVRAIVNSDPNYPVARHFKLVHNKLRDLEYTVLGTVPIFGRGGNREKSLCQLETHFILALDTRMPNGLNNSEDMHNFL